MPDIVTDVEDFFAPIEKEAVVLWDDFLGGLKYMATEGAALAAWVEKEDPAIQSQVQSLIQAGEAAASLIVAKGNPALANLISGIVDDAEQGAANLIQKATGNSPTGVAASALVTSGLTDLGQIATSAATVGYTRALASLTSAVAPITAPAPTPAPVVSVASGGGPSLPLANTGPQT